MTVSLYATQPHITFRFKHALLLSLTGWNIQLSLTGWKHTSDTTSTEECSEMMLQSELLSYRTVLA